VSGLATAAVLAATLILACCAPASIPLPAQRRTWTGPERKPFGAFARISDPHSDGNIVSGVRPEDRRWAWTARRAELRYWLLEDRPWRFVLNLYIARETLTKTGPVKISCYINGKLLGALDADEGREYTFEKPVPGSWVGTAAPVSVVIETDKVLTAPDGTELAFLLTGAGFLPQ
jgi:hypothetical protein